MNKKTWDEKEFKEAVKNSFRIREVLQKLGLQQAGGNYETIKWWINEYKIDTSHFVRTNPMKGKTYESSLKRDLETILVSNSKYSSNRLKKRLIKDKVLEEKCASCNGVSWGSRTTKNMIVKMPLELEHKNGNKFDNRLENLELLCPNCHSFTLTYGGRNKKKA